MLSAVQLGRGLWKMVHYSPFVVYLGETLDVVTVTNLRDSDNSHRMKWLNPGLLGNFRLLFLLFESLAGRLNPNKNT